MNAVSNRTSSPVGADAREVADQRSAATLRGPHGWLNWLAQRSGQPARTDSRAGGAQLIRLWQEYALYSDARFIAELELGPASVWLAFPADEPQLGHPQPQLVLRVHSHLADPQHDADAWRREDISVYHGGDLDDEFAALLSLALGRRLRSGGSTRHLLSGGEASGRPFLARHRQPQLAAPVRGASMLPGIAAEADLRDAEKLMETYSRATAADATAVVRAATQYADALWWADLDPRIAWIKLVGAMEIAAEHWSGTLGLDQLERFKRYLGPLYGRLKPSGPDVVSLVAEHLGDHAGSQERFLEFASGHADAPPAVRPEFGVVHWPELKQAMQAIYRWRSRDLHGGIPFPAPMCEPPQIDTNGVPCERFPALAAQQSGGAWPAESMPMYLHTFAYVTRQALTRWWARLPDAKLIALLSKP
jgi:hypothetical protein